MDDAAKIRCLLSAPEPVAFRWLFEELILSCEFDQNPNGMWKHDCDRTVDALRAADVGPEELVAICSVFQNRPDILFRIAEDPDSDAGSFVFSLLDPGSCPVELFAEFLQLDHISFDDDVMINFVSTCGLTAYSAVMSSNADQKYELRRSLLAYASSADADEAYLILAYLNPQTREEIIELLDLLWHDETFSLAVLQRYMLEHDIRFMCSDARYIATVSRTSGDSGLEQALKNYRLFQKIVDYPEHPDIIQDFASVYWRSPDTGPWRFSHISEYQGVPLRFYERNEEHPQGFGATKQVTAEDLIKIEKSIGQELTQGALNHIANNFVFTWSAKMFATERLGKYEKLIAPHICFDPVLQLSKALEGIYYRVFEDAQARGLPNVSYATCVIDYTLSQLEATQLRAASEQINAQVWEGASSNHKDRVRNSYSALKFLFSEEVISRGATNLFYSDKTVEQTLQLVAGGLIFDLLEYSWNNTWRNEHVPLPNICCGGSKAQPDIHFLKTTDERNHFIHELYLSATGAVTSSPARQQLSRDVLVQIMRRENLSNLDCHVEQRVPASELLGFIRNLMALADGSLSAEEIGKVVLHLLRTWWSDWRADQGDADTAREAVASSTLEALKVAPSIGSEVPYIFVPLIPDLLRSGQVPLHPAVANDYMYVGYIPEYVAEQFPDSNVDIWECFWSLYPTWHGTLPELVATVRSVFSD